VDFTRALEIERQLMQALVLSPFALTSDNNHFPDMGVVG
jgi:hypothetical protein